MVLSIDMKMDQMNNNRRTGERACDHSRNANPIAYDAIDNRDEGELKKILKKQPDLLKCMDENGLTPLSYAAFKGYVDMVVFLLKKYPKSKKYPNTDKTYPIHKACLGGHVNVLKEFYMDSSESVITRDGKGRTVLHLAARNKLKEVVIYLLSLPENTQLKLIPDENGKLPLV
ncbi:unnamed protein product [Amaranthus hypochondriacus]